MSNRYLLPCSCGQKLRVAVAQAGEQLTCGCGKTHVVPTLRGMRQLEMAPLETTSKKTLAWTPVHGAIFSLSLLAVAAGLAIATYFIWRSSQVSGFTPDRSSEVVKQDWERIDKLSPEETLNEWTETTASGIGKEVTPVWVAARQALVSYRRWITAGTLAAAVGLIAAVGTLFVGRSPAAT